MEKIDAHCHFWRPDRGDYGWLDAGGPELDPLRRDFLPADLASLNGGRRVVVVQAAPSEAETHFMLSLAGDAPQIAGVVGWVDLEALDAPARLAALAGNTCFKGVRPMLQDMADPDWIDSAPLPSAISAIHDLGLRFDALVKAPHLPALRRFCTRYPDLPVVIDHAAKPDLRHGIAEGWYRDMAELARDERIHCKLSGLLTEMSPIQNGSTASAVEMLRPVFERLLDWFGPRRLMWGSDWPVVNLAGSHDVWEKATAALLAPLAPEERAEILGGTATRFYGLKGAGDA